ncbi:CehA/McbA family metallohydrolase [bacterium]|nr:CehA/McbA family metallohydrolase [bacterium]
MLDLNLLESLSALTGIFLLYPETHYVFRCLPFSRYKKKEPEILVDAPYRLDPGRDLPLLVMIKDAHRYPVELKRLFVKLSGHASERTFEFSFNEIIKIPQWHKVVTIPVDDAFRGHVMRADCEITYAIGGALKKAYNDNFEGLSHSALTVFCADEKLPEIKGWMTGDVHYHSSYTDDQVEFGAPLDAAAAMADAVGLSFFAATDHSYDLDDRTDNFLENDPALPKWRAQQEEIHAWNARRQRCVIIPGEEVSCANMAGRNVHALVLGHPQFLPGSGDSAEKWFHTDAELSVADLARRAPEALVIAAHPQDRASWLEKFFIRRGRWTDDDARTAGVHGLQILNGLDNEAFADGLRQWVRLLLKGERRFICAGNDAHGNFNRYRQVRIPMFRLEERDRHQQFGFARTAVFLGSEECTCSNILKALREGRSQITTGPLIDWHVTGEETSALAGGTARGRFLKIHLKARSNPEAGSIQSLKLWSGEIYDRESLLKEYYYNKIYDCEEINLYNISSKKYLRCEVRTDKGFFAYSNPIWIEPIE